MYTVTPSYAHASLWSRLLTVYVTLPHSQLHAAALRDGSIRKTWQRQQGSQLQYLQQNRHHLRPLVVNVVHVVLQQR